MRASQNGFTYLELILVVFVIVVIATAGGLYLGGSSNTRALEAAERDLVSMLREAQGNALGRVNNSDWCVLIANTDESKEAMLNNSYTAQMYYGDFSGTAACSTGTAGRQLIASSRVDLTEPGNGQALSIVFEERTGKQIRGSASIWVSYYDSTNDSLKAANRVGAGGNCNEAGTGSDAWNCMVVDDHATDNLGRYTDIAFGPSGEPYISYFITTSADGDGRLKVAQYVGANGTGCGTAPAGPWNCTVVDNDAGTGGYLGRDSSIAINPSGAPYLSYYDVTDNRLKVAHYVGGGVGSGCGGGSNDWTCEVVDDHASDQLGFDTAIAFDHSGKPFVSYWNNTNGTDGLLKVAQYVGSGGTGCGIAPAGPWNCTVVDDLPGANLGRYTSIVFDHSGKPYVSYRDGTATALRIAEYVGSGGTGCGILGSTAWTCTVVENSGSDGVYSDIALDSSGAPFISHQELSALSLKVAQYIGGSSETSCVGGSSAWRCAVVDDHAIDDLGEENSIALDHTGTRYVSYYDDTNDRLKVAQYVGASGTGCGTAPAGPWNCTVVDDHAVDAPGNFSSIGSSSVSATIRIVLSADPLRAKAIRVFGGGGIVVE